MVVERFFKEKVTIGDRGIDLAAGALSYKTIARFKFDGEHQNENPAVENELHVRRFS